MSKPCQHAASGCNYPEAQCPGHCHLANRDDSDMADYTLSIEADSGYESTTEGRCTPQQYGLAMQALHDSSAPRRVFACLEVCDGVDTIELETAARYKALATGYRKRTEQRDMLLDALRMARWVVQADLDSLIETCRHPDGSMETADITLVAMYAEKLGVIDLAIENGGAA